MGQGKSVRKDGRIDFEQLQQCTHFKPQEIHAFFLRFRSEYPLGIITQDEFIKLYQEKYPDRDATAFANIVFRTFDEDKNGVVNFREFMCALSVTSRGDVVEKLRWSFRMYDADGNGYITREEATHVVRAILRIKGQDNPQNVEMHMHRIFITLDLDRDDMLCEEEFIMGASATDAIAELLKNEKDSSSSSESDD